MSGTSPCPRSSARCWTPSGLAVIVHPYVMRCHPCGPAATRVRPVCRHTRHDDAFDTVTSTRPADASRSLPATTTSCGVSDCDASFTVNRNRVAAAGTDDPSYSARPLVVLVGAAAAADRGR